MYKVDIKFGPGSYGSYWVTPDDLEAYEKSLSKQGYKVIGTSEVEVQEINIACRKAGIGCVDCKMKFAKNLNTSLVTFREKRAMFDSEPDKVWDVLNDGAVRARKIAKETIAEVKEAIGLP